MRCCRCSLSTRLPSTPKKPRARADYPGRSDPPAPEQRHMTPYATAQQAYRDSSVLTAPPERLVVMLYDGAHRFLFQAAHAMRSGDVALMNNRMQRAEAIITELRN